MRLSRNRRAGGLPKVAIKSALASILTVVISLPQASWAHTEPGRLSLVQPPAIALDPTITLSVGPTLLFESGEWVTVTWTGIESWMYPDAFVAAFSPGTVLDDPARITDVAPIKYQFLTAEKPFLGNVDESHGDRGEEWARGYDGQQPHVVTDAVQSLRFRLLNLRDAEGYRFGLFQGGVTKPVLVARTEEVVRFANPFEVLHLHLALTAEDDSMRVSWVTGDASEAPAVRFREVAVGAEQGGGTAGASWQEIAAESTMSYDRGDMCGAPATTKGFHDPGLLHSAVLTGLNPGKPYEYKAGDSRAQEWSTSSFFYAPPPSLSSYPSLSAPPSQQGAQDPRLVIAASSRPYLDGTAAHAGAETGSNHHRTKEAGGVEYVDLFYDDTGGSGSGIGETEAGATPLSGVWGPEAVKVAIFGDMGTAEVDGTLDAGHTNEPPSIQTMGILKKELRAGARPLAGEGGTWDGQGEGEAPEPQLGLVLHVGDLSYARGYDAQWDEFLDQISSVASTVPWMVGVGNHERDFPTTSSASTARQELSYFTGTDSGGECGVPTAFRFLMPGEAGKPLADSPWYSFDFGPVHFSVISTEHDFTPSSRQYAFLENDLAGVDRSKTPWVVFAGHRPMYVNSGGPGAGDCEGAAAQEEHCANDQPVAELLRSSLEPLLVEHQVDLAVYGHHHSYQRTCKVEGGVCKGISSQDIAEQNDGYAAPVHVVVGMAGMGLSQNLVSPRPEWVEYSTDREFGMGMLMADRSKLQLSFILDTDGQVADEMVLTRPPLFDESLGNNHSAEGNNQNARADLRHEEGDALRRKKDVAKALGAGNSRRSKRGNW